MEFSTSQRGNTVMLYGGYEYMKYRSTSGSITWRCRQCVNQKCKAVIRTSATSGEIIGDPPVHSHDSRPQLARAKLLRSKLKAKMSCSVDATPKQVIGQILSGVDSDIMEYMPKSSSLARSLSRYRSKSRANQGSGSNKKVILTVAMEQLGHHGGVHADHGCSHPDSHGRVSPDRGSPQLDTSNSTAETGDSSAMINFTQSKLQVSGRRDTDNQDRIPGSRIRNTSSSKLDILNRAPESPGSMQLDILSRAIQNAGSAKFGVAGHSIPDPVSGHIDIPEEFSSLILYDTGVHDAERIVAVGHHEMLEELDKPVIFGDGTFDKAPLMFEQLYSWHSQVGHTYPPCVYFLLTKRNRSTFSRMFDILLSLLPNLAPEKIILDLDKLCMASAAVTFPDAEIKTCHFYVCRNLMKQVDSAGLREDFERNLDIRVTVKSLAALSFVPVADVRNAFRDLLDTISEDDQYLNEVVSHFFYNYIEGIAGRAPSFPLEVWNNFRSATESGPEATNCCEDFHNSLHLLFYCCRPSICKFLHGLKKGIDCQRMLLENAGFSSCPQMWSDKYVNHSNRLANVTASYHDEPDKLLYLRRIANLY